MIQEHAPVLVIASGYSRENAVSTGVMESGIKDHTLLSSSISELSLLQPLLSWREPD
jgi:hypothetical protein